jgi:hypothetical protein
MGAFLAGEIEKSGQGLCPIGAMASKEAVLF